MTENQPVAVTKSGRSHWRTALQVPLLLAVAAGLGFAGQQMWQNQTPGAKLFHNSAGEFQCPIAALFGCAAKPVALSSSLESACGAHAEGCSSATAAGCSAGEDCCAEMLQAAEAAPSEAPVSALSPVNMVETL